jgi:phosphatidylglycerol:prolipoprotein diacylglycerol transferase
VTADQFQQVLATGDPHARAFWLVSAMLAGGAVIREDARSWPISTAERLGLFGAVFIGGALGALLPGAIAGGLIGEQIRRYGFGAMTILGGLLSGFFSAALYKRLFDVRWDTSDAFARGTCLQMAIGRLGCYSYHCCLGIPARNGWFAVDLGDGCPRIPIQLVESTLMFALFGLLTWLHRENRLPHRRLFLFFLLYGSLRFSLEFLREPMGTSVCGFGSYQWFALTVAAVGAYQIWKRTPLTEG